MCHTVMELSEFTGVPAVGGTNEITGDTLQTVDMGAATFRTTLHIRIGILVTTVHTTVAVVVHTAVTHIELIHHIDDTHDDLRVMGSITIHLHIEDMAATRHLMIRTLYLRLVEGGALIVYRNMVGVRIILTIGDTGDDTELLTVLLRELTAQSLCRRGEDRIVMMITLTEDIGTVTHMTDNLQT